MVAGCMGRMSAWVKRKASSWPSIIGHAPAAAAVSSAAQLVIEGESKSEGNTCSTSASVIALLGSAFHCWWRGTPLQGAREVGGTGNISIQ